MLQTEEPEKVFLMLDGSHDPEIMMAPGERSVQMLENLDRSSAIRPLRDTNFRTPYIA